MRLTQSIRKNILAKIMEDTFNAHKHVLDIEEGRIARLVRDIALGNNKAAAEALPKGFLKKNNCIVARFCGERHVLTFYTEGDDAQIFEDFLTLPYAATQWGGAEITTFGAKHSITRANEKIQASRSKLREESRFLRTKVNALLESVTTDKALLDTWPEVEKYLPAIIITPKLPAPLGREINKMISRVAKGG